MELKRKFIFINNQLKHIKLCSPEKHISLQANAKIDLKHESNSLVKDICELIKSLNRRFTEVRQQHLNHN